MGILKKNWAFKLFVVAILGITTCVSYAAQPSTQSNKVGQRANSSQVTLSYSLFHELMYKSPTEIVRYLKQRGCTLKKIPNKTYYSVTAKGGFMFVFMGKPEWGVGPIWFITSDKNVRAAWIRSLEKQGFENDGTGSWLGVNGHWPTIHIMDNSSQQAILYVKSYPLKYNPKTGGWE